MLRVLGTNKKAGEKLILAIVPALLEERTQNALELSNGGRLGMRPSAREDRRGSGRRTHVADPVCPQGPTRRLGAVMQVGKPTKTRSQERAPSGDHVDVVDDASLDQE